jgi:hypothetical protein
MTPATGGTFVEVGGAGLVLDNTVVQAGDRLGGKAFGMNNGQFAIFGGATNVNESLGTAGFGVGGGINTVTLVSQAGGGSTAFSMGGFSVGGGATVLFRGTGLGTAALGTAGTSNVMIGGAIPYMGSTGTTAGYPTRGVIGWALADGTATGVGTSFAAYDATLGVVPLQASEYVKNMVSPLVRSGSLASGTLTVSGISTSGFTVGAPVSGTGIAGNTVIASLTANTLTLSANATASGAQNLTVGPTGTMNVWVDAPVAATAGVMSVINTLTLDAGGEVNIPATGVLRLDGRAVLARGNSRINGPGLLVGLNSNSVFFHTAGAATTLTLAAPFGAAQGVRNPEMVKSGEGTLDVVAPISNMTSGLRINQGTVKLSGGVNTLLKPLPSVPTMISNLTGNTGVFVQLWPEGRLDLNGNLQAVGRLISGSGHPLHGGVVTNTGLVQAGLRVSSNSNDTIAAQINDNVALTIEGANTSTTFVSPNTMTGPLRIASAVVLNNLGSFANASRVELLGAPLTWNDNATVASPIPRLSATTPIRMSGAAFDYVSRAWTDGNVVLGPVELAAGQNYVRMQSVTGSQALTLGAVTRAEGAGLTFNQAVATGPRILMSEVPVLSNGILGGWAVTNTANTRFNSVTIGDFATYAPGIGIRPLNDYESVFATAGAQSNLRLNVGDASTALVPAEGKTVNSLKFVHRNVLANLSRGSLALASLNATTNIQSGAAVAGFTIPNDTVSTSLATGGVNLSQAPLSFQWQQQTVFGVQVRFATPTALLNVGSGGILTGYARMGSVPGDGRLTAGGSAPAAVNELFVHNMDVSGAPLFAPFTINSSIVDNPNGGKVALVIGSGAIAGTSVMLAGNNTYTGTTYANGTVLRLNSPVGFAVPGDLVATLGVNQAGYLSIASSRVEWMRSNQMPATASIRVRGQYTVDLANNNQTIKDLFLDAWGGNNNQQGPTITTGTGTLTVTGSVQVKNPLVSSAIPVITGNVGLGGGQRVFEVDPIPESPNQAMLVVNAAMRDGGVVKRGDGVLFLGGTQ